jgi:hypothetical protein
MVGVSAVSGLDCGRRGREWTDDGIFSLDYDGFRWLGKKYLTREFEDNYLVSSRLVSLRWNWR